MDTGKPSYIISIGGILAALAVLLQSAPVYMPGVGLILSPLATLPAAMGFMVSVRMGLSVYGASSLILLMISPQEAAIFALATGLLGIPLGIGYGKPFLLSAASGFLSMLIGLELLVHLVALPVFGDLTPKGGLPAELLFFAPFCLAYSVLWVFTVNWAAGMLGKSGMMPFKHSKP